MFGHIKGIERDMTQNEEPNYVQQIFYAVFTKVLPNWSDVVEFSKKSGININTLRDIYYKDGLAGVSTINKVLKALLDLTPDKVAAILQMVDNLEPVSEANRVWHSIEATPEKKLYYALCAKAIWEIEQKLDAKRSK